MENELLRSRVLHRNLTVLVSEEHTQGQKQFTRDWINTEAWKRAIWRWKVFPGAKWGDGKTKRQTSMYINVERVPFLQLHEVLRTWFCKVPFIQTVSKTTLQLTKSSVLAVCWYAVINHGRGRGKSYTQEMTWLSTVCGAGQVEDLVLGHHRADLDTWLHSSRVLRGSVKQG